MYLYSRIPPTPTKTIIVDNEEFLHIGVGKEAIVTTDMKGFVFPFGKGKPNFYTKGIDGKNYLINPCAFRKLSRYKKLPPVLKVRKSPDNTGWVLVWSKVKMAQLPSQTFLTRDIA